jgi:PAS domain S-box-containing protein
VTRQVFPLAGNEALVGFDQLSDPAYSKEAALARDTRGLTRAGPVALTRGGVGLVGLFPVLLDAPAGGTTFWGFTVAVLRIPESLTPASLQRLSDRGLGYELWRALPGTRARQIIAASSVAPLVDPVDRAVPVPNGAWVLSVAPVRGWGAPGLLGGEVLLGGICAFILASLAKVVQELHIHKLSLESAVEQRTEDLRRKVDEHRRAEQALRASEALLSQAQAAAHMGSWVWHVSGDRMEWSAEMFRIFGVPRDAPQGELVQSLAEVIHPDDRASVIQVRSTVLKGGVAKPIEFRVIWPDKSVRVVWAEGGDVVRDKRGRVLQISGFAQDVTDRRRAEHENAKLSEQLVQSQRLESIGRLAGGVAHDFNNMLGVILGCVEIVLGQAGDDSPMREDLLEIRDAARRSAKITRQLLGFARRQTIAPTVIDLNASVANIIKMIGRLIGEDIELSWSPGANLWKVKIDPAQLDQLLANLATNARDAIEGVGRIAISTSNRIIDEADSAHRPELPPGQYVLVSFGDNGCGIDKDKLGLIFEPFYTTKGVGKGTGLGLATVFGIVKQNGGYIDVESERGKGTRFRIYLPAVDAAETAMDATDPGRRPPPGGATVLVVEDEEAHLRIVQKSLSGLGYRVLGANSPAQALAMAREHAGTIDLLITDVVMPGMHGRDLATHLAHVHPETKTLYMSGYAADVIADRGVIDGTVHFLQKPFSLKQLSSMVRQVLFT